jgi:hypothetical protein
MALFSECMQWCARKVLDTADIVRDAMLRQQPLLIYVNSTPFIDLPTLPP